MLISATIFCVMRNHHYCYNCYITIIVVMQTIYDLDDDHLKSLCALPTSEWVSTLRLLNITEMEIVALIEEVHTAI